MPEQTGYSRLQIALHWLIAVLIFAAFFTHETMEKAFEARLASGAGGIEGNPPHVWLGGAAFVLILVRIVVRRISGAPGPVAGSSPLMATAAEWGHRLLYFLMAAAPLLGAITWYGGVEAAGDVHETAGKALMIVALGHAAVALWHHYVKKDDAMRRMMKPGD